MIDYETFKQKVIDFNLTEDYYFNSNTPLIKEVFVCSTLEYYGGLVGGNCYDNTVPTYEHTFETIGLNYTPLLTFLTQNNLRPISTDIFYELLMNFKTNIYSVYEYYGNRSDYFYVYIPIDTFYNLIKDNL